MYRTRSVFNIDGVNDAAVEGDSGEGDKVFLLRDDFNDCVRAEATPRNITNKHDIQVV